MGLTDLDHASSAMSAAPEDEAARLRFYELLAGAELYLLLTQEARDGKINPELFETGGLRTVLAFDREERLSGFVGGAAPYVALPGRVLAGMLAKEKLGLALNPDAGQAAQILPPDAMGWLTDLLSQNASEMTQRALQFLPPDLPDTLIEALQSRLSSAPGLLRKAYLAQVIYEGGMQGHMLALIGAAPEAHMALSRAVHEAVIFAGQDSLPLDVTFPDEDDALIAPLMRHGVVFDLPEPQAPRPYTQTAPGMDPDKPPRLR